MYPKGLTTNSHSGVEDNLEIYYHIFKEMENLDLVLNIHGEVCSDSNKVTKL